MPEAEKDNVTPAEGTDTTTDVEETGTEEGTDTDAKGSEETPVTREEFDRLFARMQAADRRASQAETKVKEYEKANLSESERLQAEREEAVKQAQALEQEVQTLRLKTAFLASTEVQWEDPEDALELLVRKYSDDVEIDEKGRIKGMDAAIKRLAKEKSYLVKKNDVPPASSSDTMNGSRKGDDGKRAPDKESLKSRFPALGR